MLKRAYIYLAAVLTVVAMVVRTLELSFMIDEKGFYLENYLTLCHVLEIFALILVVGLLVVGRVCFKTAHSAGFPKKNVPLGAGALVCAMTCVLQAVTDYSVMSGNLGLIALICGFVTALGFGIVGMSLVNNKTVPFSAACLPVVGQLAYLVVQYAGFNGITRMSESVIYVLFIASFLGLTMSQCRLLSGVNSQKGLAYAYGSAAATAFFGLCASMPHYIAGNNHTPLTYITLGAGVYALVLLFQLPAMEKEKVEEPTQEELITEE